MGYAAAAEIENLRMLAIGMDGDRCLALGAVQQMKRIGQHDGSFGEATLNSPSTKALRFSGGT